MENRSVSFGITGIGVVVALVALAFRGTPPPATQVAVGTAPPVSATRETDVQYDTPDAAVAAYSRGRRLVAEYLGGSWGAISESRDTTVRARLPLRVTLVTIPDPYDSHMDWSYDANLEALRRAMGTAGFVPQSFWLPQRTDSLRVVTNGLSVRYPAHDYQPGVFLFRSTNVDAPALHLVYLIPEVPTSGVHMQAFRAALAERKSLMTEGVGIFAVDARERAELSVLGPNFSGSAISLRAVIDAALVPKGGTPATDADPRTAHLVSGSATSFQNLHVLTDRSCVVVQRRDLVGAVRDTESVARIRFAATVNPDEALDDVLRDVIDSLHVLPYQVAVLTESGTAYGAARPSGDTASRPSTAAPAGPACTNSGAAVQAPPLPALQAPRRQAQTPKPPVVDAAGRASAVSRYLTVPFPLNIASLRSEFEKSPNAAESSPAIPTLTDVPRTHLSLDEASRARETPLLTSNLSTPSLDVVLESLIRTLNEHDVRVVVIKATDVRDKLMLARELRRGVRDVVLVVYEGHVLLRRPEYADALRGALVLSSYPMALENQFWTTAHRRTTSDSTYVRLHDLLAFPTDAAIGTYNAALSLLGLPQLRVEFDLHNAFAPDSTYHFPPVWLSVVGRDGFYPLRAEVPAVAWQAYLGPPTVPAANDTTVGERVHEHSYTHDDISLSIIIVVPAVLIAGLLAMFLTGRDGLNRMGLVLPESLERPASATESLYLALFVLSLSATYLPFSVAIDARRIVASVDAYAGGPSVAMWIVLSLFVLVLLLGLVLLANGFHGLVWGATAAPTTMERRAPTRRTPEGSPATKGGAGGATPARTRSIRAKLDDFLRPMRAEGGVTGSMPSVAEPDDVDEYEQQTTRLESKLVARLGIATITIASVLFVVASLAYTWHLLSFSFSGGIEATLSMYRALHLASGVSPLLPLVLLGGGFAIWTWWQLQQARTFDHPDHFESGLRHLAHTRESAALWRRAYRVIVEARRGLSWIAPGLGVTWILLAIGVSAWFILRRRLPSLEVVADTVSGGDRWFDAALWLGIVSLIVSTSWAIYRLVHTWNALERFLDIVSGTPLASAFARLPLDVVQLTNVGFLGYRRDDRNDGRYATELWERAKSDVTEGESVTGDALATGLSGALGRVQALTRGSDSVQQSLDALRQGWELARTRPDPAKDAPLEPAGVAPVQGRALRSLEEYIACEVVLYLEQYLLNLRRLCFFLFASLLILVVVDAQYPFQPHSIVSLASILLLGFTVVSVFFVMLRMSRNVALSRISRTEPGKVTWDTTLILNIVTFAIIPLLALATSEFPAVRAFLFSWADPVVRAVART